MEVTDLKGLKFPVNKSDNPPTLICGHGGELCNDDGSLQVLDIPENCMFITFADCGLSYGAKPVYDVIVKNERNLHYFEDPIRYKDELEDILKRKIHIHHPNAENEVSRTYVNTQYRLIGDIIRDDHCQMQLSGLVPLKKENLKNIYETESNRFDCTSLKAWGLYYSASIYPTKKQVAPFFGKQLASSLSELVDKIPVVTQQFLFKNRPGIYFNPLCRLNNCDVKHVVNRQYKSSRAINRNLNTDLEYIKNIINNCISYDDCPLLNEKKHLLDNLNKSELYKIKDDLEARAKYFKLTEKENYIRVLNDINELIEDISTINNHNGFRTIVIPDLPKKYRFNDYELVKVGGKHIRSRSVKKKVAKLRKSRRFTR